MKVFDMATLQFNMYLMCKSMFFLRNKKATFSLKLFYCVIETNLYFLCHLVLSKPRAL